jgi:hypothetical protein
VAAKLLLDEFGWLDGAQACVEDQSRISPQFR